MNKSTAAATVTIVNGQPVINLVKGGTIFDNELAYLERTNKTVPFSQRLNDYVELWFDQQKDIFEFVDEDDFDGDDLQGTLNKYITYFNTTGKIKIWTGASEFTIFGSDSINHKFRAWHDYIHITYGLGFDLAGESLVAEIQKQMLPSHWEFEKNLVHSEIIGQAQYFSMNGDFIVNQRLFTVTYLRDAWVAMHLPIE